MTARHAPICLCLLVLTAGSLPARAEGRYALLVASGHFAPGAHFSQLSAPENDVRLMSSLLTLKFGFKPADITLVGVPPDRRWPGYRYASPDATFDTLAREFKRLAENRKAGREDYVVFYYSGHGIRVEDLDGDEPDGYDEALLTYEGTESYAVVDDVLHAWLQRIPARQITVIADTCYSGNITRFIDGRRKVKFVSFASKPPTRTQSTPTPPLAPELRASDVLLSACRPQEEAREECVSGPTGPQFVSSFTWELYRELVWSRQPQVSCSELAQTLAVRLASRRRGQTPTVYPARSEAVFIAPPPKSACRSYVPVLRRDSMPVRLGLGYFAGVRQGMEFAPEATLTSSGPVLRVTNTDWFESSARVVKGTGEIPSSLVARQPPVPTPGRRLSIAVRKKGAGGVPDELPRLLEEVATFDEEGASDAFLDYDAATQRVQLVEHDEHRFGEPVDPVRAKELVARYRASLQIGQLDSSVHPLGLRISSPGRDRPTYRIGDPIRFTVEAERSGYLLVLDVAADGQINVLFPNVAATDAAIVGGHPYMLGGPEMPFTLEACPPAGDDRVVAILSTRPLPDLDVLLKQPEEAAQQGARSVRLGQETNLLSIVASVLRPSAEEPRSRGVPGPDAIVDVASLTVRVTEAGPADAGSANPETSEILH
jgi:hypothetical protein